MFLRNISLLHALTKVKFRVSARGGNETGRLICRARGLD